MVIELDEITAVIVKDFFLNFIKTQDVFCRDLGLCFNLNECMEDTPFCAYAVIGEYSSSWKYFSGDENYPIQSKDSEYETVQEQYDMSSLYEGDQLRLRLSLAKHIVKCLERDYNV